jgi:hypothetical protein
VVHAATSNGLMEIHPFLLADSEGFPANAHRTIFSAANTTALLIQVKLPECFFC